VAEAKKAQGANVTRQPSVSARHSRQKPRGEQVKLHPGDEWNPNKNMFVILMALPPFHFVPIDYRMLTANSRADGLGRQTQPCLFRFLLR